MRLLITGLNHRTAPVELRERLAFSESALPEALKALQERPELNESMILSTCNRVEIAVTSEEERDPRDPVELFLRESRGVAEADLTGHLYRYEGSEAIRHIFRVAASLDSMVIGEPQILGPLKAAYAVAKAQGSVNGFLETVLTKAFAVAKRVRNETEIGQSAVSISYAAVELAREIFGSLAKSHVLLIGAGKMSELAARHLRRSGAPGIFVTNRTRSRAESMAGLFGGEVIEYGRFKESLAEMDIIITSSGATEYVLTKQDMRDAAKRRRNRPVFVIDIAVPRNVEPGVNELENVFLYDIDDLQRVVETNLKGRLKEAEQAEAIIAEEVERLTLRMKMREVTPVIVGLQEQLEQWRVAEIQRSRGKLGQLTPQQEEAIDALTKGIINKVAHGPITELRKQAARPEGLHVLDVIRKVFRLGGDS